jgi:hypothetical protein
MIGGLDLDADRNAVPHLYAIHVGRKRHCRLLMWLLRQRELLKRRWVELVGLAC